MENLQQIKDVIASYVKLEALVRDKVKIMNQVDDAYATARGIEAISFEDDIVNVRCDDSFMGILDHYHFDFPVAYLALRDDALKEVCLVNKQKLLEAARLKKEQDALGKQRLQDAKEFEQYLTLKQKFSD